MTGRPTRSTLFPYTTLFRSHRVAADGTVELAGEHQHRVADGLEVEPPEVGPPDEPVVLALDGVRGVRVVALDRKSTRLNSSHATITYAVFCLNKKAPLQTPL